MSKRDRPAGCGIGNATTDSLILQTPISAATKEMADAGGRVISDIFDFSPESAERIAADVYQIMEERRVYAGTIL